jgi:hypothetical protein
MRILHVSSVLFRPVLASVRFVLRVQGQGYFLGLSKSIHVHKAVMVRMFKSQLLSLYAIY